MRTRVGVVIELPAEMVLVMPNVAMGDKFCESNPTIPVSVPLGIRFIHIKRRWMTEQYHRRIQKKWDKQIGIMVSDE